MTQLTEQIKLGDAKVFFPNSRQVFVGFGLEESDFDDMTLKAVCEAHQLDLEELLLEICLQDVENTFFCAGA